jgi:hypothetical protein
MSGWNIPDKPEHHSSGRPLTKKEKDDAYRGIVNELRKLPPGKRSTERRWR